MKFTFENTYNQKTLSVMAKCIRKTVRKAKSKRSHIFGWIVAVLGILLSLSSGEEGFVIDVGKIMTWLAVVVILGALIFEDQINGYFAKKRMLPGTEKVVATFDTANIDSFRSGTAVGKSEFSYDKIGLVAETDAYFVFIFSSSHAQIYDKNHLSGGTCEEFREFISERTNKSIITVR